MKYFSKVAMVLLVGLFACNTTTKRSDAKVIYKAEWESLVLHKTPEWFLDAKFGIYCHWGPYSVPAHETEWYSHYMYVDGHPIREYHEKTYGPLSKFGYKDFVPMFSAENFDAAEWAALFKNAGAKFAGPVSLHADGFAMWDTELTRWNAANMGPKRNIVGELEKAIREQDMKFIATFHHHWKYAWYSTWDENTDASDPEYADLYGPYVPPGQFDGLTNPEPMPDEKFQKEWIDKIIEFVDTYHPDLMWFDNKMHIIDEQLRMDMVSHYYNHAVSRNQEVVLTYKAKDLKVGSAVLDLERSRMAEKKEFPWLTDDSIDWGAWCDVSDPDYKSTNRLIDFLIDVISKNGCVLLNVTPTAQGEIPEAVKERLLEMGAWLKLNGEAVYGTRPWKIFGEGPAEVVEGHLSERQNTGNSEKDIRFTQKDDELYALILDLPTEDILIRSLGSGSGLCESSFKEISLLGSDELVTWEINEDFLRITAPNEMPCDHAIVYKLNFN